MIRYPFDPLQVWAIVLAADKKWFEKAAQRTNAFLAAGQYNESSNIWSVAKLAFIDLQHGKCAYCERRFEDKRLGSIEHDLEHFRPKNGAEVWPDAATKPWLTYAFPTGAAFAEGYYWLAYDLLNYAASCKVCNTILKSNYFPIRGARPAIPSAAGPGHSPEALLTEEPLLCYPIGNWDDDPESLITFDATIAVPVETNGHRHERAKVIIDFFELNERELLHRERAQMICLVAPCLKKAAAGEVLTVTEQAVIDKAGSSSLPHSSCVRAHVKLWKTNPLHAEQVHQRCLAYTFNETATAPP
jgi:hypothetical protein